MGMGALEWTMAILDRLFADLLGRTLSERRARIIIAGQRLARGSDPQL